MFDSDEFIEVEGRQYVNPQTALTESNDFITNLRNTQQANTQQIVSDTRNLGTEVPSNLGGLTGSESYFTSRYQTPQTAANVANLRATAQAAALNQALANEQAVWKKRYQDAYNAYQKRSWDKTTGGGGGGASSTELEIDVNSGEDGNGVASENTNTGAGQYIPVTDYVGDYLSEDGSQWWQLGSLRQTDELNFLGDTLDVSTNGSIRTGANGITYMYLKNNQFPNGRWFRATRSAGPGTYSPYAGEQ